MLLFVLAVNVLVWLMLIDKFSSDNVKLISSTSSVEGVLSMLLPQLVTFEPYHYFSLFEHQSMIKC